MTARQSKELAAQLAGAEQDVLDAHKRLNEVRRKLGGVVEDHTLWDLDGKKITLSSLFGDKEDLIVVHNMGKRCSYCTLWADGFNGEHEHLENRAAFVLVSHDAPEAVRSFSEGRNWRFRVVSNNGGEFSKDMGYQTPDGNPQPGISTFHKDADGVIRRISTASLGPGDEFCAVWHIFDMLKDGPNGWEPKFKYR